MTLRCDITEQVRCPFLVVLPNAMQLVRMHADVSKFRSLSKLCGPQLIYTTALRLQPRQLVRGFMPSTFLCSTLQESINMQVCLGATSPAGCTATFWALMGASP